MKNSIFTCILCLLFFTNSFSQSITRLLAASPFDNVLRILDSSNYTQLSTKNIVSNIGSVSGVFGLAKRPSTGVYYTIFNFAGNRYLGTMNLNTGSITAVGNLNDNFSQLTINGNNTLLGVTGSGAAVPNTVYRINPTNAAKTSIGVVPSGNGQVICYNPSNNRVYHWTQSYPYNLTSFDTLFSSPIAIPGSNSGELMGAVYKTSNSFVTYDWDQNFMKVHGGGNTSGQVAFMTQSMKALAYVTCSRTIAATSASVCANGAITFTMSGSSGATYQWFKNGVLIPGATSITYSTLGGGYFKCSITDVCGTDSLAPGKNIFVLSTPTVAITGPSVACVGQTVQLVGSSGGSSQWYKNGVLIAGATTNSYVVSVPGTYNMIKVNLNACQDSAQSGKAVTFLSNPTVSILGPSSVCSGASTSYTANGAGTYTWSNLATGNVVTFTPATSTSYSVIGANAGVCFGTAVISVSVVPSPVINIASSSSVVCLNSTSATLIGSGGLTYTWLPGGANTNSISVSPVSNTTYTLIGADAAGCKNSSTLPLTVANLPTVTAAAAFSVVCPNEPARLTAGGALSYSWNTGATTSSIIVTSSVTSIYTVTGTDANGCSATKTVQIKVSASCVGINELNSNPNYEMRLSPNPTNGELTIESEDKIKSVEVYDLAGKLLHKEIVTPVYQHQINLSFLNNSIYLIRVTHLSGKINESKLIVDK